MYVLSQVFVIFKQATVLINRSRVLAQCSPAHPGEGFYDDSFKSEVEWRHIVGSRLLPENVDLSEDFYFMSEEEVNVVERSDSKD